MKESKNKRAFQVGALLTTAELKARMASSEPPDQRIYLKPILDEEDQIGDGSINVRLGTHFLVPKAPDLGHVTPKDMDADYVRRFQTPVVKSFGEPFILHPHHLVLGVTFEFLSLPGDIAATVLSRSSFGRVGLLVPPLFYRVI